MFFSGGEKGNRFCGIFFSGGAKGNRFCGMFFSGGEKGSQFCGMFFSGGAKGNQSCGLNNNGFCVAVGSRVVGTRSVRLLLLRSPGWFVDHSVHLFASMGVPFLAAATRQDQADALTFV